MTRTPTVHLVLPPARFYWAVLAVDGLPRRRRRDATALGYLFESALPVPVEEVHATYAAAQGDSARIIACAIPTTDLAELARENPSALTLTPAALPAFIDAANPQVATHRLNFMTAGFEPQPVRRARRRLIGQAAVLLLMTSIMIVAGLQRRANIVARHVTALQDRRNEILEAAVGKLTSSTAQPPELRMLAELRSLQQTRDRMGGAGRAAAAATATADVLESFASLLQGWPQDLQIRAESVLITPSTMTVRGLAPSSSDVQRLADALSGLPGWRLEQPQISATGASEVQATLQWKFEQPPSSATLSEASR